MPIRDPCDDATIREWWDDNARAFIEVHLFEVAVGGDGWEVWYTCPWSGQLWLEDHPHFEEYGGGPMRLRVVHEPPAWHDRTG